MTAERAVTCETEVPCSFFSVRREEPLLPWVPEVFLARFPVSVIGRHFRPPRARKTSTPETAQEKPLAPKVNLWSQAHDFVSCMRQLRQHLSRETPLPVLETKRHFLLFRRNSLQKLRSKKLQYVGNSCFIGKCVA